MGEKKDTGQKNIKRLIFYFFIFIVVLLMMGQILANAFNLDTSLFVFFAILIGLIYAFIVLIQDHIAYKKQIKDKSKKHVDKRYEAFVAGFILNLILLNWLEGGYNLFALSNIVTGYIFWIITDGWLRKKSDWRTYGLILLLGGLIINWSVAFLIPYIAVFGLMLNGAGVLILELENYMAQKRIEPLTRLILYEIAMVLGILGFVMGF